MNFEKKIDRRKKYYLVFDCETATLPFTNSLEGKDKQTIAIAKPLIYDLGWQVIDRKGNVFRRRSYLVSEIFQYRRFLIPHTMQVKDRFILKN